MATYADDLTSVSLHVPSLVEEVERIIIITEQLDPVTETIIEASEPRIKYIEREPVAIELGTEGNKQTITVTGEDIEGVVNRLLEKQRIEFEEREDELLIHLLTMYNERRRRW
jgi:hypothetical protein